MDVVYLVGPGEREQMRYSLRSLANLPHDIVWIVGCRPSWLAHGTKYLPVPRHPVKWQSAAANLRRACSYAPISPDFILMNDDFYIMDPVDEVEALHRGPIVEVHRRAVSKAGDSRYAAGMIESHRILTTVYDIKEPVHYGLHLPIVYNKYRLLETLDVSERLRDPRVQATDIRTMYGNLTGLGGRQVEDVKLHKHQLGFQNDLPYRSTSPATWASSDTDFIRAAFQEPCGHER